MVIRVRAALIGLVLVLLALVIGAMPASAGRLAGGGPGASAFILEPSQPGPPTGLTATAVSSSEVDLSWTAPSGSPPAGYDVYEGTSSGDESNNPVNSDPITGTTFSVTGLTGGTTYYFVVDAVDAANNLSGDSNEASATTATLGQPGPPAASTGSSGTSAQPWLILVVLAVIGGAVAGALLMMRRRRSRSAPGPGTHATPGPGTHATPGPGTHATDEPGTHATPGPGTHATPGPGTHATPGPGTHAADEPSIRAVPHVGPPQVVSIYATGTEAACTVRIESHPGTGITTIEETPPR